MFVLHVYILILLVFFFTLFSCMFRSITYIQLLYKEMPTFQTVDFFTPCQLHTIVSALVLCSITLFDSLMMVLCGLRHLGLFKHHIIIQISKEQVCAFCWLSVVNEQNKQCKACLT